MSHIKQQLVSQLVQALTVQARDAGYVSVNIDDAMSRRIERTTVTQLQDELDRISGKKTLMQLPADHICFVIN